MLTIGTPALLRMLVAAGTIMKDARRKTRGAGGLCGGAPAYWLGATSRKNNWATKEKNISETNISMTGHFDTITTNR